MESHHDTHDVIEVIIMLTGTTTVSQPAPTDPSEASKRKRDTMQPPQSSKRFHVDSDETNISSFTPITPPSSRSTRPHTAPVDSGHVTPPPLPPTHKNAATSPMKDSLFPPIDQFRITPPSLNNRTTFSFKDVPSLDTQKQNPTAKPYDGYYHKPSLNLQVRQLCDDISSLEPPQKEELITVINRILVDHLSYPLSLETIDNDAAKESLTLIRAIQSFITDQETPYDNRKLSIFLDQVESKMGKSYPLKGWTDNHTKSLYEKQYNDDLILAEKNLIHKAVTNFIRKSFKETSPSGDKGEIVILDYGAGNGRNFETLQEIATLFPHHKFKVLALDPSLEGLKVYEERLKEKKFLETRSPKSFKYPELHDIPESGTGYIGKSYENENIEVQFIHTNELDSVPYIQSLLQSLNTKHTVDITLCLFGVLSCIPGKKNRQDILKMFHDINNPQGEINLTLPSPSRFLADQKFFNDTRKRYKEAPDLLRQHFKQLGEPGEPGEPGDIFYLKKVLGEDGATKLIELYYHIYTAEEIEKELKESGLQGQATTLNISSHLDLANKPWRQKVDAFMAGLASSFEYFIPARFSHFFTDTVSSYMQCVCSVTPEQAKEEVPPPTSMRPTKLTRIPHPQHHAVPLCQ